MLSAVTAKALASICPLAGCNESLFSQEISLCPRCFSLSVRCRKCGILNRPDTKYCRGCGNVTVCDHTASKSFDQNLKDLGHRRLEGSGWVGKPFSNSGSLWVINSSHRIVPLFPDVKRPEGYSVNFEDGAIPESLLAHASFNFLEGFDGGRESATTRLGSFLYVADNQTIFGISLAAVPSGVPALTGSSCARSAPGHRYIFQHLGETGSDLLAVGKYGLAVIEKPLSGSRLVLAGVGWANGKRMSLPLDGGTEVAGPVAWDGGFVVLGSKAFWLVHSNAGSILSSSVPTNYPSDFVPYLSAAKLPPTLKLISGSAPFSLCRSNGRIFVHILGMRNGRPAIMTVQPGNGESAKFFELAKNASVSDLPEGGLLVHEDRVFYSFGASYGEQAVRFQSAPFKLGFPVRKSGDWAVGFAQEREASLLLVNLRDSNRRKFVNFDGGPLQPEQIMALELEGPRLLLSYSTIQANAIESYCWGTTGN